MIKMDMNNKLVMRSNSIGNYGECVAERYTYEHVPDGQDIHFYVDMECEWMAPSLFKADRRILQVVRQPDEWLLNYGIQTKFPKSKKKRIRKKWSKNAGNYVIPVPVFEEFNGQ